MVLAIRISELHVSCSWTRITSVQLSDVFCNMGMIIYNVIQIALGSIPGRRVAKIWCEMNLIM
jgi:hypothetical protein